MPFAPLRNNRSQRHRGLRPSEETVTVWVVAALAALALTASTAALATAAVNSSPGARAAAAASKRAPVRQRAPRALSPADRARVAAVPSFSWARLRGAVKYEFQLAADHQFKSIVVVQGRSSVQVANRFATVDKTLADGTYYWRVRGIDRRGRAGRWSPVRSIVKSWGTRPALLSPSEGAAVTYPRTPLVLRWGAVPYAYKYRVTIATDPSLANSALGPRTPNIDTSATAFALPGTLSPGRYYWAVTPLDADKHPGARSAVGSFDWSWPSATTPRVADLNGDPGVFDPQFSWDPVPGAAGYQVEINPSQDFAVGSRVCCDESATGTSLSPRNVLPNNTYYWRVRAVDVDGNAGVWNTGPSFRKGFRDVVPSIPNLHVRDNVADRQPAPGLSGLPTTDAPTIAWDPVPGASSYEVNVAPWDTTSFATPFCNWTPARPNLAWTATMTAATAWSPLAPSWGGGRPVGNAFLTASADVGRSLLPDTSYCVRVRARSDRDAARREIVSDWTQIGGVGRPAFTYRKRDVACSPAAMPASAYREPQAGATTSRMPLFTWDWVPGACGYYVVVARDPAFTDVIDVALTTQPSYAPRQANAPKTYPDETTLYYWAVMPTATANGGGLSTQATEDAPQAFHKRSVPPALIAPADGSDVAGQASFRWSGAEGAREYQLQVDNDPTFGSPLDNVVTDATAYTSTRAYPADTALYWRVRANDENRVGLTWSATGTFRRRLPVPALSPENPLGGEAIPVLAWSPVQGAVSYDLHVEQADGTRRDFNMRSSAFTPTVFYGTGIWRWQVRANFKAGLQASAGGYSGLLPFARRIATPTGVHTTKTGDAALLSWDPASQAREYRVQISDTDSFRTIVESVVTKNTSYAPARTNPAFRSGGPLYWRVATVDEGGNLGGWATSALQQGRRMRVRASGRLAHGRMGTARVRITDARGRAVAGVLVRVAGRGVRVRPKRTGRRGSVAFRIRATRRGTVTFRAEKRGYTPAVGTLRVR